MPKPHKTDYYIRDIPERYRPIAAQAILNVMIADGEVSVPTESDMRETNLQYELYVLKERQATVRRVNLAMQDLVDADAETWELLRLTEPDKLTHLRNLLLRLPRKNPMESSE